MLAWYSVRISKQLWSLVYYTRVNKSTKTKGTNKKKTKSILQFNKTFDPATQNILYTTMRSYVDEAVSYICNLEFFSNYVRDWQCGGYSSTTHLTSSCYVLHGHWIARGGSSKTILYQTVHSLARMFRAYFTYANETSSIRGADSRLTCPRQIKEHRLHSNETARIVVDKTE